MCSATLAAIVSGWENGQVQPVPLLLRKIYCLDVEAQPVSKKNKQLGLPFINLVSLLNQADAV